MKKLLIAMKNVLDTCDSCGFCLWLFMVCGAISPLFYIKTTLDIVGAFVVIMICGGIAVVTAYKAIKDEYNKL